VRQIATKYLDEVVATLRRSGKALVVDPGALDRLVHEGHSLAYGARFLKRVIDDRIKLPISQQWKEANCFRVSVRDEQIVVDAVGPRLLVAHPDAVAV
jgi:ATP-dependent Clp protease ATP-binding subunit ClpA